MKLSCDRQELADALGLAAVVVNARSTRPILANVCVVVEPTRLQVLATDLEVGLRVTCTRVEADGSSRFLLEASRAHAILREMVDDRLEIEVLDGTVELRSTSGRYRMVEEDASEFPAIPERSTDPGFEISRSVLEGMLKRTSFAAAHEGMRYALNGVLFDVSPERLRFVATDGKRLALAEHAADDAVRFGSAAPEHIQRVVSNKAVQLLGRMAGAEDERVKLVFRDNQVVAETARTVLSAQLVQGKFPPYEDVIPKNLDKKVEFETAVFAAALRRAALLTTKDSQAVRFSLTYNRLQLSSRIPGVGESTVELPVAYESDPIETAFNPTYVADALKVMTEPRFTIEMRESTTPCVLRAGEGFRYVVMPIDLT